MLRPGLRLRGWVPKPSPWLPSPDGGAIGQTRGRGRGDGRGAGGWAAGGAGGGLSPPQGGARGPAPARRPSPAGKVGLQEAGVAGATRSWRRTSPGLRGLEPPGCAAGKEGRSLPPRLVLLLHRLAPPLPGCGRSLPSPRPRRGVSRTPDQSASRPHSAFGAPRGGSRYPNARQRPVHASRPLLHRVPPVRTVVPLTHIRVRSPGPLFCGAVSTHDPWRPESHPPFAPAQESQPRCQESGVGSGSAPLDTRLGPANNAIGSRK